MEQELWSNGTRTSHFISSRRQETGLDSVENISIKLMHDRCGIKYKIYIKYLMQKYNVQNV